MIVSNEQYYESVVLLRKYQDRDEYIENGMKMKEWEGTGGRSTEEERREYLGVIYDAAHRDVRDIADAMGYSLRQLAKRWGVQYNSLFSWSRGDSNPHYPLYLALQELSGLLFIPRE